MEEVISSSLKGFVFEKNLNLWRSEKKMKIWESPFIPSHFNFQKVSNFTQSITQQSNNQSNLSICITFQNLEFLGCYTHTLLKFWRSSKWISQSKGSCLCYKVWSWVKLNARPLQKIERKWKSFPMLQP